MTSPHPTGLGPPEVPARRAYRSADQALLGGVAAGLADHLGISVTVVRVFFVVTALTGFGVVFYAALWLLLPMDTRPAHHLSPGLESATRLGRRPGGRRAAIRDAGPLLALVLVGLGVAALLEGTLGGGPLWWPLVIAVTGVAVLWRQADEAQRERWLDGAGRVSLREVLLGRGGTTAWARLALGLGLLTTALVLVAVQTGRTSQAGYVLVAGLIGVVGIALTVGPWLLRLASELTEERAARIRSQERADVAAHLHDSVLQTLALIQRSAEDPTRVAALARAQERDLRQWMYGAAPAADGTFAARLRAAAAEVEDAYDVPVELVTVGDCPGADVEPLVLAAREAIVNAARHSGAPRVDVYAEASPGRAEVFVRDRGRGFDVDDIPAERLGVRRSIVDRLARHGGTSDVRSSAEEGTEVRLAMTPAGSGGGNGGPAAAGHEGREGAAP